MYKIILADDHNIFRESLAFMLTKSGVAEIIGEASNGRELLKLLEQHTPDLVLLDIGMPIMDGCAAAKEATKLYPDLKILALSSFDDEMHYHKMIDAGAKGFIIKDTNKKELEQAITTVAGGGGWFSNELLRKVIKSFSNKTASSNLLSEREVEILHHICTAKTNEQIAEELSISYDTVRKHRSNLLEKTGSSNTAALVMWAIRNKLVDI